MGGRVHRKEALFMAVRVFARDSMKKHYCRRRIAKLLYSVLSVPMTLIVAHTGYEKTSSVNSFFSRRKDIRVFHFSPGDRPVSEEELWPAFCREVSRDRPEVEEALMEIGLPREEKDREAAASLLYRGLTGINVLVLDDFHNCSSASFMAFLTAVARQRPEHLCMVLLSRRHPDFMQADFFQSDLCGMIGQSDLAYTQEEIAEYFHNNGCPLSEEDVVKADSLAQGWPLAVHLLKEEYQQSGLLRQTKKDIQSVQEVLAEELPPEDQLFYARLSLAESFTVEQAAYITQERKAKYRLARLYQENCFLELDQDRGAYALLPLIRSALRDMLPLLESDLSQLYLRYAAWYDFHGQQLPALRFYHMAGDRDRILELLSEPYATLLVDKDPVAVHNAFPGIGARSRRKYAAALCTDIYTQLVYLDREEGLQRLEKLKEFFTEAVEKGSAPEELLGEIALLEGIADVNNLSLLASHLQEAAAHFNGGHSIVLAPSNSFLCGSPSLLWRYHTKPGSMRETAGKIFELIGRSAVLTKNRPYPLGRLAQAEHAYNVGNLEAAKHLAYRAIYGARPRGMYDVVSAALFILGRTSVLEGEFENVFIYRSELNSLRPKPFVYPGPLAPAFYISSLLGEIQPATKGFTLPICNDFIMKIIGGRQILAQGPDVSLELFAENMLLDTGAPVFESLYAYLYLAAAKERMGECAQADRALCSAAELARPDGIVAPFLENAPYIKNILARSTHPFLKNLKEKANAHCVALEEFAKRPSPYALSEKELQIVRWYAGGGRQAEVAKSLNLSVTEVRRTINEIYQKTGMTNISEIAALVLRKS